MRPTAADAPKLSGAMHYSRRRFLQHSAALVAGAGAAAVLPASLLARRRAVAPSDRVRVGLVGCNGMGWANLTSLLKLPEVEAVALCDVDRNVLDRRSAELEKLVGQKPAGYADFRRMLEDQTIDAVVVATPDHWHPLITIAACQAGKDVYVEKPLANSIEECDAMVAAARRYDRVVQVGQWQRSGPHWDSAMAFVQSGALGDIRTVKAWAYQGWMKNVPPVPDEPVPAGVDYDMWLGPAPARPFNRNRFHFNFRWYWDYAGGLMTDWGVHLIDMALYGMQATAPKSVLSLGGNFAYPGSAMETPDTQQALYEYDGFSMIWEHAVGINNGPYGRDHGVAFIGNDGTLVVDRGKWEVIPEHEDGRAKMEPVAGEAASGRDLDLHTADFVACMKSRETPKCPPEIGRLAAVNAHLGNVAFKTGRRVYWDEQTNRFTGDDEANALVKSRYRAPWVLPTV